MAEQLIERDFASRQHILDAKTAHEAVGIYWGIQIYNFVENQHMHSVPEGIYQELGRYIGLLSEELDEEKISTNGVIPAILTGAALQIGINTRHNTIFPQRHETQTDGETVYARMDCNDSFTKIWPPESDK